MTPPDVTVVVRDPAVLEDIDVVSDHDVCRTDRYKILEHAA
jgi:hypothetical protein